MNIKKRLLCMGVLSTLFGVGNVLQGYTRTIKNHMSYPLNYEISYWGCRSDKSDNFSGPIPSHDKRRFINNCLLHKIKVHTKIKGKDNIFFDKSTEYVAGTGERIGSKTYVVTVKNPSAKPKNIEIIIRRK